MSVLNTILLVIGVIGSACSMKINVTPLANQYLKGVPTVILGVLSTANGKEDPYFTFGYIHPNVFGDDDVISKGIGKYYAAESQTEAFEIILDNFVKIQVNRKNTGVSNAKVKNDFGKTMATSTFRDGNYDLDNDVLVAAFFTKQEGEETAILDVEVLDNQIVDENTENRNKYKVAKIEVDEGSPVFLFNKSTNQSKGIYGKLTTVVDGVATLTVFSDDFQLQVE